MRGSTRSTRAEAPTPKVVVRVLEFTSDEISVELSGALTGRPCFPITSLHQGGKRHLTVQIDHHYELAGRKGNREPMEIALRKAFPDCIVHTRSLVKSSQPVRRNQQPIVRDEQDDPRPRDSGGGSGKGYKPASY